MDLTSEQARAYTEVVEVLKYVPSEELEKIPQDIYQYYEENMDTSYDFSIDTSKSFQDQDLMYETKVVLAILFRDYWATEKQREIIKQKENYDIEQIELKKKEKYNSNVFENNESKKSNTITNEEKSLKETKEEPWYIKIINNIKRFFNKQKI